MHDTPTCGYSSRVPCCIRRAWGWGGSHADALLLIDKEFDGAYSLGVPIIIRRAWGWGALQRIVLGVSKVESGKQQGTLSTDFAA